MTRREAAWAEGDERREARGERLLVLENLGTERQRETRGGRREERCERRESACVRKFRNREAEGGERREARGEAAERFQGKARCSSRVNHLILHRGKFCVPPGLRRQGTNLVCRLNKLLYGLKHTSRQWFSKFTESVLVAGFIRSKGLKFLVRNREYVFPRGNTFLTYLKTVALWEPNHTKLSDAGDLLKDSSQFRRMVGCLIYLTITRPGITYTVHVLSRFMHAPRIPHMETSLRIFKYLKNAPGQGLFFLAKNNLKLHAYCDSDWAGCPMTRRSMTAHLATKLLCDLHLIHLEASILHCDNKATLHIAANPVFHDKTRHIEMNFHFIRDKIQDGSISTQFIPYSQQLADMFTKPLGKDPFLSMLGKLGVLDIHSST
uniref:Reverse transcriptase Ty1/copia-type domain-containing protein n=1 Tax=Salix viminalis TaxID=40686 RepID=A0A6N2MG87_SALVM